MIRYRQDDDKRSLCYDDLLAAESKAEKNNVGLHCKKPYITHRVAEVTGVCMKVLLHFGGIVEQLTDVS